MPAEAPDDLALLLDFATTPADEALLSTAYLGRQTARDWSREGNFTSARDRLLECITLIEGIATPAPAPEVSISSSLFMEFCGSLRADLARVMWELGADETKLVTLLDEARKYYEGSASSSGVVTCWCLAADIYADSGDLSEAAECVRRALRAGGYTSLQQGSRVATEQ